ncbi:MAG TPA: hypothetical protein VGN52_06555 [Burkholderiales bacterium]
MADVMSSAEWMKLTYGGRTSIRSGALKRLDAALAAYEKAPNPVQMEALRKALVAWMSEKGSDWKNSIRNGKNAVDTLYRQVTGLAPGAAADSAGLQAMKDEAHQVMLLIFRGAQITWKNEFRGKLNWNLVKPFHLSTKKPLNGDSAPALAVKQYVTSGANNKVGIALNTGGVAIASSTINSLRTGGNAGGGATGSLITKLVGQVVPPGAQVEVLNAVRILVPTFHAQFAAAVMPLAGILTAAAGTLWNTGTALHKQYGVVQTRMHRDRSLAGVEARHAINALVRILERERNADIYSASVSVAELGGKIAGLAIDGGTASNTAIGLAANIAKLLNIVRIVYRDVSEKNAANRLMASGKVTIEIFEVSPLVGCYLVCCLPTSALMALIFERFGERGWMDVAERTNAHHLEPLRAKARDVIHSHRFEIRSLSRFPGMLKANDAELKRMAENVGKSKYVGFGSAAVA